MGAVCWFFLDDVTSHSTMDDDGYIFSFHEMTVDFYCYDGDHGLVGHFY